MQRTLALLLPTLFLVLSCGTYSIKSDVMDRSALSSLEHSGLLLRLFVHDTMKRDEYRQNLTTWLAAYTNDEETTPHFTMLESATVMTTFQSPSHRFYQRDMEGKFLRYKSLGQIRTSHMEKKEELQALMDEKNLDSMILYEVDGTFSAELQFVTLSSMVVVIDHELNILYMDHQRNRYDLETFNRNVAKREYLDHVSQRLCGTLQELGYLKKAD